VCGLCVVLGEKVRIVGMGNNLREAKEVFFKFAWVYESR
jgi:hypothetical protein